MSTPLKIVAVLVAKPGRADDLEALLRSMAANSRTEAGNIRFDLWRDVDQPDRFVLDELYKDGDAVAFHRASSYFQAYLTKIGDLAERTPMLLSPQDVV